MRRFAMAVALAASVALVLVSLAPAASANNDPHRFFLPQGSFDWAAAPDGPCDFPVHLDTVVNKEYASQTTLADGSTVLKYTGVMKVRVSANGTSLDLNASGPGEMIFAPDGTTWSFAMGGRFIILNPGLTALGYPSNMVLTTGLFEGTMAAADNWAGSVFISAGHLGQLALDICAALA
jgi:hypothetical protein